MKGFVTLRVGRPFSPTGHGLGLVGASGLNWSEPRGRPRDELFTQVVVHPIIVISCCLLECDDSLCL